MFDRWACGGEARGDGGKEMERCLTWEKRDLWSTCDSSQHLGWRWKGEKKVRMIVQTFETKYSFITLRYYIWDISPNTNLMVALEGKAGISSHQVIGIQVCTINITIKWRTNPSRKCWHIVFHRISENFLPAKQSISSGHQGYLNKIHFSLDQKGAT